MNEQPIKIEDEIFQIERLRDDDNLMITALHGEDFTLDAKEPLENNHKSALHLYLSLLADPEAKGFFTPKHQDQYFADSRFNNMFDERPKGLR